MRKRITLLLVALMMALTMVFASVAMAQPNPRWSVQVTNPGGNQPPGQQDEQRGRAHTTTVTNPGGNQPPGQQP